MRRNVAADLVRGVAALGTLIVLMAGVPVALVVLVGWPLPHSIPTLAQLRRALSANSLSDAALVDTLAVACWLAWAAAFLCAGTEAISWLRGQAAGRVPMAGLLQPAIRQLVMTTALLAGPFRSPTITTTHLGLLTVSTVPQLFVDKSAPVQSTASAPSTAVHAVPSRTDTAEIDLPVYEVQRSDDLWQLAEIHLGNPLRWRELYDLNAGARQPDGHALSDPNLILPRWLLRFPADAVGLSSANVHEAPIARTTTNGTAPIGTLPCASPGQNNSVARIPPEVADRGGPRHPLTPSPPGNHERSGSRQPHQTGGHGTPVAVPIGILGTGLAATGLVITLDRLRKVQQRRRRPGRRIRMPTSDLAPTEVTLRRAASGEPGTTLDLVLRALASCWRQRRNGSSPAVEAVSVRDDRIEVLLREPVYAPHGPFSVTAGGRSWAMQIDSAKEEAQRLAEDMSAPLPALVTVGASEAGDVLIDLESGPVTCLIGDPTECQAMIDAIAYELASSVWADHLDLVVATGHRRAGLESLERVRFIEHLDEVADQLISSASVIANQLKDEGMASALEARTGATAGGEPWTPTIVLTDSESVDRRCLNRLIQHAGPGLALLHVGSLPDVTRRIRLDRQESVIEPLGLHLRPRSWSAEVVNAVDALIETACDTADVEPEPSPVMGNEAVTSARNKEGDDVWPPPLGDSAEDAGVKVRVLGPVEIEGIDAPIKRRKSVELVAYLALHPMGVDDDRIMCALWPEERPSRTLFNTVVSEARTALGATADGNPRLAHVRQGLYRLELSVICDAVLLEAYYETARRNTAAPAIGRLAEVLGLIRGLPFSGACPGFEWAHTERHFHRLVAVAADASHLVAECYLNAGEPAAANAVAMQGLLASPANEVLYRDRMLAADAAGNPAGVEAAMAELCREVDAVEPYDTLHPETVELYRRLTQRDKGLTARER